MIRGYSPVTDDYFYGFTLNIILIFEFKIIFLNWWIALLNDNKMTNEKNYEIKTIKISKKYKNHWKLTRLIRLIKLKKNYINNQHLKTYSFYSSETKLSINFKHSFRLVISTFSPYYSSNTMAWNQS